ncbi:MAG: cellulase family glycosylhydrolase [Acidimicrobiales bacterium]
MKSTYGRILRRGAVLAVSMAVMGVIMATAGTAPTRLAPALVGSGSSPWCDAHPASPNVVGGCVTAPGGPFLRDSLGRSLILHGVNAVFKTPPYEFTSAANSANSLTATDASEMAGLGFDVVRLGIIWKGLEPGTGTLSMNSPAACTEGLAGDPGQFSAATIDSYLAQVDATVSLLAKYGIYSLIDMHQDVYNEAFAGEGAPDWAVCTNNLPPTNTGNWSANYFTPAVGVAFEHFWDNDVTGGLQQNYDAVWARVAAHFKDNPSVIGYDLFNEPFSTAIATGAGNVLFDAKLECFYTGTATPGAQSQTGLSLACPPTDPAQGVIPSIENADPNHLVFYEPDVANDFGDTNWIGAMPFGRLVLDFHDYCLASAGQAYYDFYSSPACSGPEPLAISQEKQARAAASTPEQQGGPAWFMSEFGAGEDTVDLTRMTGLADQNLLSWAYWQWKQYDDPTGGSTEALVATGPSGDVLDPVKAPILVRPYAQAVAGAPGTMSYDAATKVFTLSYTPEATITAPTVVFVPVDPFYDVYPGGYCAQATGATVSGAGTDHLLLQAGPGAAEVTLRIAQGSC